VSDLQFDKAVLIIDDSWFARNTLAKQLRELHFEKFLEAGDADQALSLLEGGGVGLIFCDQQMPGMSGVQLLRELRSNKAFNETLFILVTAHGDKELVDECSDLGGDGVLNKPFSTAELQDKIEQAFQARTQSQG
jgi:two-component system, chemotaxis family, chemotaxis protein CheY